LNSRAIVGTARLATATDRVLGARADALLGHDLVNNEFLDRARVRDEQKTDYEELIAEMAKLGR
jgi:hypothetical protein